MRRDCSESVLKVAGPLGCVLPARLIEGESVEQVARIGLELFVSLRGENDGLPAAKQLFPFLDLMFQAARADGTLIDIEEGDIFVDHLVEKDDELDKVGVSLLPERFFASAKEIGQQGRDAIRQRVGVQIVI